MELLLAGDNVALFAICNSWMETMRCCAFVLSALFFACSPLLSKASSASDSASARIPLTFERNVGQAPAPYAYLSRHQGVQVFFAAGSADFLVPLKQSGYRMLQMRFAQASGAVAPDPRSPLPGRDNYLVGNNPRQWKTGIPTYGEVAYPGLYPGIDLLFYGGRGGATLEHDFVVSAGADPSRIRFHLAGADGVRVGSDGKLVVSVADRQLIFEAPVAWQMSPEGRTSVKVNFQAQTDGTIGFSVGAWDRSRTLTIDPVLVFGTYLDGTGGDSISAIATDSSGNIYVTGTTSSTDFPTANPEQAKSAGSSDVFLAKLDKTGHSLLYSTYLGGSNEDQAFSIAVDANGNAAVSGTSLSRDFPSAGKLSANITTYTTTYNFIASLTADGSQLRYSGFIGDTPGGFDDYNPRQNLVAFDAQGNAYLSGVTQDYYPWTSGSYGATPASYPADPTLFIAKVGSDGTIAWAADVPEASSPGTWGHRIDIGGLAVDSAGAAIVAGAAGTVLPTTAGVLSPTFPNNSAALYATAGYVLKLNPQGSALVFSTYLPGTDAVEGLAQDASGNIYVSGETAEANLPTNANAYQPAFGQSATCDCEDAFVLELSSDGAKAIAATYFNGSQTAGSISGPGTVLRDIRVDPSGNIAVQGLTSAANLPLVNPLVSAFGTAELPSIDDTMVVARFSSDLSVLQFSSFLNPTDYAASGSAMTTDPQGHILVAGNTLSRYFPTTSGAFQATAPSPANSYSTLNYQFLASIDASTPAPSLCLDTTSVAFGTILVNAESSATVNATNCGNAALTLSSLTSSNSLVTATSNCTAVAPASVCQIQIVYSPTTLGSITGTLSIAGNMGIGPQQVAFTGTAGAPSVSFPASIAFPSLMVGQTGAEEGLAIVNVGNGPFVLSSASVTGDFSIVTNGCTAPILQNQSCDIVLNFSPTGAGTRNGSLILNDNLAPATQAISLTGEGLTSAPVPGITSVPALPVQSSGTGQLYVYGTNFMPNSTVKWNGTALTTTYGGPGLLVGSVPVANLQQVGEASVSVSTPPPGGGTSGSLTVTIFGQLANIAILNEVYDPVTQLLYATVSNSSINNANSLVAIDPVAMKVVSTLLTGNQPDALATSGDSSLLYVGLDGSQSVAQLSLPSGATNFTVKVPSGNDSFLAQYGTMASALAVVPGHPHTWLVGLCYIDVAPCGDGVAIFDDAVERANEANATQLTVNSLAFVNDPTVVYSTQFNQAPPSVSSYAITSSGIALTGTSPFLPGEGGEPLHSDGKMLFVANGQVIDPATLNLKFTYPQSGTALAIDSATQRLFFSGYGAPYYAGVNLAAVDEATEATIGVIGFPSYGYATDVQRFGTKGVVINSQNQGLIFVQTSLATAAVPKQIVYASPSSLIFPAQAVNTSSASQAIVLTNGASTTVTLNSFAVTANYAQTNNCAATLAPAASCTIDVTFAPTASGDQPGQLTITDSANPATLVVPLDGAGVAALSYTASVSPTSLTFASQPEGSASSPQSVLLANTGTGALTLSGISVTGDFAQTNDCGTSLAVAASCTIHVTFAPTASGDRTGSLAISDNATAGPQTVSLDGGGTSSFTLAPSASGGAAVTVAAGSTATYNLDLASAGYAGPVTLTCSGAPAYAACSVTPSSATVTASQSLPFTVTIATNGQTAALSQVDHGLRLAGFSILSIVVLPLLFVLRRRAHRLGLLLLFFAVLCLGSTGCGGGGGGSSSTQPVNHNTAPGTYTIAITVTGGSASTTEQLKLIVQ